MVDNKKEKDPSYVYEYGIYRIDHNFDGVTLHPVKNGKLGEINLEKFVEGSDQTYYLKDIMGFVVWISKFIKVVQGIGGNYTNDLGSDFGKFVTNMYDSFKSR